MLKSVLNRLKLFDENSVGGIYNFVTKRGAVR